MARSEYTVAGPRHLWWVQLDFHQLVHIVQDHHVTVELHHPLVLGQRERGELAPAVVESHVIDIIFGN